MTRKLQVKSSRSPRFMRPAVPDSLDLRDRMYQPTVAVIPDQSHLPKLPIPVLNQENTNACTGFALASVIYYLMRSAKRTHAESKVSPYMLYAMARRYDEFPGDPNLDEGSSARGGMSGWYKFGACSTNLWPSLTTPPLAKSTAKDWWLDAVYRPLGAYYRVDHRSVTDMHVAINEVGILYVTAACHDGWDAGADVKVKGMWRIPTKKALPSDGGHAFVIVGYDKDGFIIQNSWDTNWGSNGRALLAYEDWLDNAMDCWVAQLGVVTDLHMEIAQSPTLRLRNGKVHIASDASLGQREINPFIIDMENNGRLSNTGDFRTDETDINELVTTHLGLARKAWGLRDQDTIDIAIYAHGGLTSEDTAAETAQRWIPALYDAKIFPIFLMWETDLMSTLKNRLEDVLKGEPRMAGGLLDTAKKWWNARLEKLLAHPGSMIWGEMKQNGQAISQAQDSGGIKLYEACKKSPFFSDLSKVRIHLIGHSAGAIAHSYIIKKLVTLGWTFETVNFLAPAVRIDTFKDCVATALKQGAVKRLNQFHLSDEAEQKDPTCKPILGYSRSLLYLVSESFEGGVQTPILGMQKYFSGLDGLPNVQAFTAPGTQSQSTTHGGFDEDKTTMSSVILLIQGKSI
jgi:Papain family cysteine protease